MEIFIPLMVAAIQSAGPVLAAFASKAKEIADKHIFDKEFVENTVIESSEQLAKLISVASSDLKEEIKEQSIIDVVQELQAHVASLGELLSFVKTSEITPAMAERLITGGLLPLRVSLKKAELRLSQYGRDDVRLFCHVVGTNTLIAGYVYAGQSVPTLQKDLEDSIYVFQKRLLDAIAKSNIEIPWNNVPHLLTTEGITNLYELYTLSLQGLEKNSSIENHSTLSEKSNLKPNISTVEKKEIHKISGNAKILRDPFVFSNLVCSECGYKGFSRNVSTCPKCKRKFV